jgi:ketosteroid isomerase-like protein
MKSLNIFLFLYCILVLTSNYTNAQNAKVDLKDDELAIRSISMKWLELAKKHDITNLTALFVNDGVIYREHQDPAVGFAGIKAQFTKDFKDNPRLVPNWTTDHVTISASGDLAVEYGSWNDTGRGPEGTGSDHGRFVTVYRKVNGTWKVSSDFSLSTRPETQAK